MTARERKYLTGHNRNIRCYYDDELCEGEVSQVGSFKKYLCDKCRKEDDSVCDEPLDTGHHAMDYLE